MDLGVSSAFRSTTNTPLPWSGGQILKWTRHNQDPTSSGGMLRSATVDGPNIQTIELWGRRGPRG